MKLRIAFMGILAAAGLSVGADLQACGDKFLVGGRGTRYQRPKNFRPATILIYASPSSSLEAALRKVPVESVLKREGHRSSKVEAPDQLSAILASGGFDVVLAASSDTAAVEALLGEGPEKPVLLAICPKGADKQERDIKCALKAPKAHTLLEAIDKAVELHDRNVRKAQTSL